MGPNATLSCADAIGKALERRYVSGAAAAAAGAPEPQLSLVEVAQGACPDCGGIDRARGRLCGVSGVRLLQVRLKATGALRRAARRRATDDGRRP